MSSPYEPREDSFLIKKHVKDFCTSDFFVLDVGTGSGILALEAAKYAKKVIAIDIDQDVIDKLKKEQDPSSSISFIQSDLFSNINPKDKFDLIIFNPPYIPTKKNEFKYQDLDGGKNGTEIIERFLKEAKEFLKKDGKILLLTSSLNKNIEKFFKKYAYTHQLLDREKFSFEELCVWILTLNCKKS